LFRFMELLSGHFYMLVLVGKLQPRDTKPHITLSPLKPPYVISQPRANDSRICIVGKLRKVLLRDLYATMVRSSSLRNCGSSSSRGCGQRHAQDMPTRVCERGSIDCLGDATTNANRTSTPSRAKNTIKE